MRTELAKINHTRARFHGTFERYGKKQSSYAPAPTITVLLMNVCNSDGEVVADHLWMNETNDMKLHKLETGDTMSFDARVAPYRKGYDKSRLDYRLSHPTQITITKLNKKKQLTLF